VRGKKKEIQTASAKLYSGIILPLEDGDDNNQSCIMDIIPELAMFFETKKRTPIKVVFETVKLSELKEKEKA